MSDRPITRSATWRCQDEFVNEDGIDHCRRPLTGRWVGVPLNKDKPEEFAAVCLSCAGVGPVEEPPAKPQVHRWILLGIVVGNSWWWVPMVVKWLIR